MLRHVLASLALCSLASAQLSIRPGQDLQAAVNAAPDGSWILIHGGSYPGPLVIENKSIALVGAAPWTLGTWHSVLWPGTQWQTQQGWCIEARGRADQILVIHNARLDGMTAGSLWHRGGGPIRIEGYGSVWIVDTLAIGFDARDVDRRDAVPGIMYLAQGGFLLLERSAVLGGVPSSYLVSGTTIAPPAAPALYAPGSTVQTMIAFVRGGNGDRYRIESSYNDPPTWRPTPNPCPCPGYAGAEGGNAIVAATLLTPELAILEGGAGASTTLNIYSPIGTLYVPWGHQTHGVPFQRVP